MSDEIEWTRVIGVSAVFYRADTAHGRIRITRVNKRGVAPFRIRYPDGKEITVDTIDEAKSVAAANAEKHAKPEPVQP